MTKVPKPIVRSLYEISVGYKHLLEASGTPIGAYDLQIAAIALANDLTLVTHNVREFSRVADLKVEDWETQNSIP